MDWPTNKAKQPCCIAWELAHQTASDNEGYGPLISYDKDRNAEIGADLPPVKFCPWCGAEKK